VDRKRTVLIGRLLRARGIRGEIVGELDSSEPGREDRLKDVTLELKDRTKAVRVERVWSNPSIYDGRPVFKFEGIDSMTDIEPWQGAGILVAEEEVAKPEEGAYSFADLVGSRVVQAASGEEIGVVEGIAEYGGPPLLQVRCADGREILIPFAKSICQQIDAAAKTIGVELPEGLLDLP
jgi:16S rRNA processing protein RimM